jgi:hypothetical protein
MALVQAIMPLSRSIVRAFGGPEWSTPLLFLSSFAVAAVLVALSLYPFSAAGRVRRLPLLRGVLAVLGVLLVWRGIFLPVDIAGAVGYGPTADQVTWAGILTSAGTLTTGVCCLTGLVLSWRALAESGRHLERSQQHIERNRQPGLRERSRA